MPWGISWGNGLFRIGTSPSGRKWASFGVFGFRFFHYLDGDGRTGRWRRRQPEVIEDSGDEDSKRVDEKSENQRLLDRLD